MIWLWFITSISTLLLGMFLNARPYPYSTIPVQRVIAYEQQHQHFYPKLLDYNQLWYILFFLFSSRQVVSLRDGTGGDNQRRDQNKMFRNSHSKSGLCESENLPFLFDTLLSLRHSDHPERSNPNSLWCLYTVLRAHKQPWQLGQIKSTFYNRCWSYSGSFL